MVFQQCFRLTYKNPVPCEAIPMPDSFPALLDHLGGSISDLFFVSDKGGVNWVEFVRGYNKCCARMSASVSLNKLLRVFSVTLREAGSPSNLEFESDDADCKITGSLMPADVLMLLWMCWAMSWYSRTSKISNEKVYLRLPDVKHVVLSAIVSCAEAGGGLNVWDCDFSGLGVQLPVGKFQSWVLKTVPSLPDCFTQFVHAIIKNCVSQKVCDIPYRLNKIQGLRVFISLIFHYRVALPICYHGLNVHYHITLGVSFMCFGTCLYNELLF